MTIPDFHVRTVVRTVLDTSESADPTDLARAVSAEIPDARLRDALDQILPQIVRQEISFNRMRHTPSVDQLRPVQPGRRGASSAAWIRESWRQRLDERYPGVSGWRFLRDFTAEDCDFAAEIREKESALLAASADLLRRLGQNIRDYRVGRAGDLPEEAKQALFQ